MSRVVSSAYALSVWVYRYDGVPPPAIRCRVYVSTGEIQLYRAVSGPNHRSRPALATWNGLSRQIIPGSLLP